jgi:hypothetical protein
MNNNVQIYKQLSIKKTKVYFFYSYLKPTCMKSVTRLFQYLDFKGIKPTKFEKTIGLSNGYLALQLKRNGHFGEDIMNKIIDNCLDLNPIWLLTGNGKMLVEQQNGKQEFAKQYNEIPLFIDTLIESADIQQANRFINMGDCFQNASMVMSIRGNYMIPDYMPGCYIAGKLVKNKELIIYGKDYVIFTSEYCVIRRLQKSLLQDALLVCSCNLTEWEKGPLKGRLINEPFDLKISLIESLYEVIGKIEVL